MRIGRLFISVVLISLVSYSCKKGPTDVGNGNNNHYDPRNVSRNEGKSILPSLTVDDFGNVHLVWADSTPGNYEILYSTKSSSGDWSEPVNISNTPTESKSPKIAIEPSGDLHVVWQEWKYEDGWIAIFYSMKPQGGNWTVPMKISTNGGQIPDLGIDASGNVHVTWLGWISYRMKSADGTWMSKEDVFQFGVNPAIAVSKEGDVHIVCDENMFGLCNIFYSTKPFGGSWTEYVNISESPRYSWAADVAVDNEGSVYVVWTEEQKGMVYLSVKSLLGSWTKPDSIANTRGRPWVSHLVIGSDKSLHLVWSERVSLSEIRYLKRDTDGVWSDVINVSETSGNSLCASIALDTSGNLYIAWQDKTPGNWDIFYTIIQTR